FAMLAQALLPSIVYAANSNGQLAEICTAYGIKKMAVDGAQSTEAGSSYKHCPLCTLSQLLALPTDDVTPDFVPAIVSVDVVLAAQPDHIAPHLLPYLRGPPS